MSINHVAVVIKEIPISRTVIIYGVAKHGYEELHMPETPSSVDSIQLQTHGCLIYR